MNTKIDNLLQVLNALSFNISKMRCENHRSERFIANTLYRWMDYKVGTDLQSDNDMHVDMQYIEYWNSRIYKNEIRIKSQQALHDQLLETYNQMEWAELESILAKQIAVELC